ncbi:hypothetical protein [Streptomyces bohaiensis]|uniref:Type IV secretion system protein n=1 Tax=Streptomyces bohaiensis TaxID=1431344 RepID=A0ABX1C2Q8_9ACTN|nr:hypothetical protein [Streptomyces bohaiensis]NJQ13532.1 hypothetical protein [Streptomyces bohaiensis]
MCGLTDWSGCVVEAGASAFVAMTNAISDATAWIVVESFTWWVDTDSSVTLNTGVVDQIRNVTWPLTVTVAAAGMILAGIRMVMTGRADPLLSLGEGVAKLVVWTVSGTAILTLFLQAASAFSGWVLDEAKTRELGARLSGAYGQEPSISIGAILLLSILGFLAGVVQWVIGLLREAAIVILAGCIPLAAAGQLIGQSWLGRVVGWTMALIWWQPTAALVYFAAYAMITEADSGQDMLIGITMLVIAIAALPALLKLFSWATEAAGQGRLTGGSGPGSGGGSAPRMPVQGMTRLINSGMPRGGGRGGVSTGSPSAGLPAGTGPGSGPAGAVPGARTPSSSAAAPSTGATPAAGGGGTVASGATATGGAAPAGSAAAISSTAPAAGGATAAAGGGAAAGGASAGAAGTVAAGAKAGAVGGPVGAAAGATAAAAAAGAKAAGAAMTDPPKSDEKKTEGS